MSIPAPNARPPVMKQRPTPPTMTSPRGNAPPGVLRDRVHHLAGVADPLQVLAPLELGLGERAHPRHALPEDPSKALVHTSNFDTMYVCQSARRLRSTNSC